MATTRPGHPTVLSRGSFSESTRISAILRKETVGGMLLVGAAIVASLWANSPCTSN
jgi:NhaA family Na+:H+ antiporter